MPRRPLPNIPRLKTAPRRTPQGILLGCPRISPEWELAALQALIKPQTKSAILHRRAEQILPRGTADQIARLLESFAAQTGYRPTLHWPPAGDYHFAATLSPADLPHARALALAISHSLPTIWLTLGSHFIHNAQFFRRKRRTPLHLIPDNEINGPTASDN